MLLITRNSGQARFPYVFTDLVGTGISQNTIHVAIRKETTRETYVVGSLSNHSQMLCRTQG